MENVTLKSTYDFSDRIYMFTAKLYDIVQQLKIIRLDAVENYTCNNEEKFVAKILLEEALMELNKRGKSSSDITKFYTEADPINVDLIKVGKGNKEISNLPIDLLDHWHEVERLSNLWNDSSLYTKKLEEFKEKAMTKEQEKNANSEPEQDDLEKAKEELNKLAQEINQQNQQHGGQPQQQRTAQAGAGYPPFTTGDVSNNTSPNISSPCMIPMNHALTAVNDAITMTPIEESKVKVTSSENPLNATSYSVGDLLNNNIKHIPELVSNWGRIPVAMQESLKLPLSIAVEHLWQKQKKGNVGKFKIQDTNLRYNNFILESENGQHQIQVIHCRPGEFKINIKSDDPEELSTRQTSTEQVETEKTSKTTKTPEAKKESEVETKTSKAKTTKAKKTTETKTTKTKKATETKAPETKETETKESTAN